MENKNHSLLFQNCLIIFPDIDQILSFNNIYKRKEENIVKNKYNWIIFSEEFSKILEIFKQNQSDIFACHNLISIIKENKATFLFHLFEYLNIFSIERYSKEESHIENILIEIVNFIKNIIEKKTFSLEEVYLSVLLILYIFLQESITGSSFTFIKESEKTDYSKDLEKFNESNFMIMENNLSTNFKKEIYEYLSVNGEMPYNNIKLVLFFAISYKLIIQSDLFNKFEVNSLWKARVLFLQDKLLRDPTMFIKEEIFKNFNLFKLEYFEELYKLDESEENNKIKLILNKYSIESLDHKDYQILNGLLKLEKSFMSLRYYKYKECENEIEEAKNLFGLKINLSGRLGKKTKYQEFETAVLVVESSSSTLEKSKELCSEINQKENNKEKIFQESTEENSNVPEEKPTGIPRKVMLREENPLLENPNITDINKIQSTTLSLYDQLYVSALLNSYKHTYPDEDLLREVILTYVNKSIEKSYDWLVFSKLLLHKSLAEEKKSKTIERSLLQIESLCLQYNDRLPNSFSRMKFIFTVDYPFIWKLKKMYADMFMSYGAFMTAFDLYVELGMHEECVNCLYLAGKNERALQYAQDIIKAQKDPGLYCVLGEINKNEDYFHKALEVSNGKYTRAYRCLGKFNMVQNKVEEAIQFYEKAMEINPIFPEIWFSLGCLYLRRQNWELACRSFARSVQLDDSLSESWANLGISFVKLGKNREALKAFEEAYKISRRNWKILENLVYVAIDCEEIQKIINGMNDLYDLDKQDSVTPNMFYKLITILLEKYDKLDKREVEYFKEKIYLIFEKFSMKSGTTPEIWDLYIFFIDCLEIKLNKDKFDEEDIQKFYQAMIEIRLKQIRNYMLLDVWENDEKCIEKIKILLEKLKNDLIKVKDVNYINEINTFIGTTKGKIERYYKKKEFEKNNHIL